MKIYKLANVIDVGEHSKNYAEIGHYVNKDPANPSILWIHMHGKLETQPVLETFDVHSSWVGTSNEFYRGRFDTHSKKVSLIYPWFASYPRRIPNQVLKDLYREFGPEIQIYAFS